MSVVGKVHQLLRRGFPGAPDRELVVLRAHVAAEVSARACDRSCRLEPGYAVQGVNMTVSP